jgi:hypothetical protein
MTETNVRFGHLVCNQDDVKPKPANTAAVLR